MRIGWYLEQIRDGVILPAAKPSIEMEKGSTAILRGNGAFGIYGMKIAAELAIAKARESHIAAVALTDVGHTGRIGQFAEQIAAEGMFGQILGGGNHATWGCVAPHGGRKPLLPTNPYALGLPAGKHGAVIGDFATSAVATGKLRLYRASGTPVPLGWILDRDGQPTTNAEDFFQGGMQLPAAGPKGYALSVLAEMIGKSLLGAPREFNWLVIALEHRRVQTEGRLFASLRRASRRDQERPAGGRLQGSHAARRAGAPDRAGAPGTGNPHSRRGLGAHRGGGPKRRGGCR